MGRALRVKCSTCGQEVTYMLGIGMRYFSLEAVLDMKGYWKQRGKIREVLNTLEPDFVDYEHKLYACPECGTLHQRFYITMRKNKSILYESQFRCGKCRKKLRLAKKDITRYRCPSCGQRTLECAGEMMWD